MTRNAEMQSRSMSTSALAAAVLMIVGTASPSTSHAQVAGDDGDQADAISQLDTITVTARKRAEDLQDVPIAISAFTGETLLKQGVMDTKELFDAIPNFSFVRRGAYVPIPTVRGVYSGVNDPTSEPSVGFYLNDVYISSANQLDMSLLDIERVEVLRGPQGTLYGRNTLGGAVKIITRAPSDYVSVDARASYGSHDLFDVSGGVSGALVPGVLTARLSAAVRQSDGYLYNTVLDKDVEYEDYKGALLTMQYTPNERLTVDLVADVTRSKPSTGNPETYETSFLEQCRAAAVGVLLPGCPAFAAGFGYDSNTTPHDKVISRDIESTQDIKGGGLSLTARYEFDAVELTSITAWRKFSTLLQEDRDGSPYPIVSPFTQDYETKALSQEFRLSSIDDARLQWTLGAYGFRDQRDMYETAGSVRPGVFSAAAPASLVEPNGPFPEGTRFALFNEMLNETVDLSSSSVALFGQATYAVTDRLAVTLGARQTWESRDIDLLSVCDGGPCPILSVLLPDGTILPPAPGPPVLLTDSASEKVFSPLATVAYDLTPDVLLYATSSKGFKSGGYAPVFTFAVRPFESESAWNHELGMKSSWFDRRLTLNASVFLFDWENVQINNFTETAGFVVQNAASVENKGLELDVLARLTRELSVGGAYGYLDSKYVGDLSPVCADGQSSACSVDQSLRRPQAPRHSLSFFVDYRRPLAGNWNLGARLDYSLKTDILSRIDQIGTADDPQAINTGRLLLDETYRIVNARLGLQSDRWGVHLWAKNLLDEKYYGYAYEFAGAVGAAYGFPGQRRTVGVELSYRY